jgi:hypothetical protein
MTTSAQVRTAWQTHVWDSATVSALTDKVYLYDVSQDSQFDAAKLYYDAAVNFFLCLVQRRQELGMSGQVDQTFEVRVTYHLQQTDQPESTYNALLDRLEAVDDLVRTALGGRWQGTVDYWQGGTPDRVTRVEVDGRQCWRGGYTYLGFKATT